MTPEEIYDRYGEKMFHYAALRLGSSEDAEDILQETFFRLSRYPIRWAFIQNTKAYVFRILRNETNRFLRRKISRPQSQLDGLEPESEYPVTGSLSESDAQTDLEDSGRDSSIVDESGDHLPARLVQSLTALPDEQREVIILKVFQDLSFKEIAAVCGLSINTAASRYRYGLEKLRASWTSEK